MFTTINDCYAALLEKSGGIETVITRDELRDIIHDEGLTYPEVTHKFLNAVWYSRVTGGEYKPGSWKEAPSDL